MIPEHSPEPWRYADGAGPVDVTLLDSNGRTITAYCRVADARRIVACVNALKDVPTEVLERGDIDKTLPRFREEKHDA